MLLGFLRKHLTGPRGLPGPQGMHGRDGVVDPDTFYAMLKEMVVPGGGLTFLYDDEARQLTIRTRRPGEPEKAYKGRPGIKD